MKTFLPLLLITTFLTSCSLFQDNSSIDNQEFKNKKTIEKDINRVKEIREIVNSLFNRRKEICPKIASCNITSSTQLDKLVSLSQSTEELSSEISKRLSYYQNGEKSMAAVNIMVAYFANLSSLETTYTITWIIILNNIKKNSGLRSRVISLYNKNFLQSFRLNSKYSNPFSSSTIIRIAVKYELHPKVALSDNSFKQFQLKVRKLRTKDRENTKKALAKAMLYLKSDTKKYYQEMYFVTKNSVPTRRQARQEVLEFLKQFPPIAI